ncbi:MAG: biosynthetic-type acetolactate synthase large subunit [Desulfitobacterium hafniense]|nr:biosynthetic-type acetolactate synthase large subunit [Desulfitobacterium hafniense]
MALWGTEKEDVQDNLTESNKERVSGAELLVRFLEQKGVTQVYGIPGAGILPVYDVILDSDKITSFNVRHEQMAIFMADGYSRVTGKVGVCAATSGPGATNFLTGLYSAYVDSVPLIALTGQVPTMYLGKDAFQEAPMVEMARPVTKGAYLLTKVEDLPEVLKEAWQLATTGRKGPVLLDLPLDVQKSSVDVDLNEFLACEEEEILPKASDEELNTAWQLICTAEQPVLLVGGGLVLADASEELRSVAELLQIPVVSSLMGKDSFPNDHPLYAGMMGTMCQTPLGNKTILESDLVINLGGRFDGRSTGTVGVFKEGRKIIHVNIDSKELGRHVETDVSIKADVKDFLQRLAKLIRESGYIVDVRKTQKVIALQIERLKLARQTKFETFPMKPQQAIAELRECLKRDAIVTLDCGISQIWATQLFEAYEPRTFLITGRAGTMGWGLGAALAAKLAKPDVQAVNLVGDASLGMSLQDLATAAKHNIPVVVFLLNNSLFGLIRQQQNLFYSQRWISTELDYENMEMGHNRGVDFVQTARGMGVAGELVQKPEEIKPALERAFASGRPYLIEVLVDPFAVCPVSMDGTIKGVAETV